MENKEFYEEYKIKIRQIPFLVKIDRLIQRVRNVTGQVPTKIHSNTT